MTTSTTAPADISAGNLNVALGERWYPLENFRGQSFRWVQNDAVVHMAALDAAQHVLRLVVEPGPGAGSKPIQIGARLADGTELPPVTVKWKEPITFDLPPESPRVFTATLHCTTEGKPTTSDDRVLNFRVFELAVERRPDVFPAWAKATNNFYPLESHAGQAFRWVKNDAKIDLYGTRGAELCFDVESGPGLESEPFTLDVQSAGGTTVVSAKVGARTTVRVPMTGLENSSALVLHVEGGGKLLRTDPRVLNFRVFNCGV
jgi:hypothetical protein